MSDLIKRSDAIEAYADIYWIDDRLNLAYREELDQIDEKIRNIPTVEIADRPQGEWVRYMGDIWTCSACGESLMCDDIECNNYCPNCGARMLVKNRRKSRVSHEKGADDDL